jgi:hypothetical protein
MTEAKLTFQGTDYTVNTITDYHIQYLAGLYNEGGTEFNYDLEKHSQVLKLIFEYICPGLPKRFVKITPKGDYFWITSLADFATLLVAIASCYAVHFDAGKALSDKDRADIAEAVVLLAPTEEAKVDEVTQLKEKIAQLEAAKNG